MLLDLVLGTLWPSRCAGCAAFVPEGTSFCPSCLETLVSLGVCCSGCAMPLAEQSGLCPGCRRRPFPFSAATAALAYGGALTDALLRFKHGGHRHVSVPLARYLGPAIAWSWQQSDLVCPVPLHRRRLKTRGFNQAWELLRDCRHQLAKPERTKLAPNLLDRTIDTPALGHGSPSARALAVAGAFVVPRPTRVAGKHVLVVDDVMTSGATLAECARVLLASGAAKVAVAALARAI